jgi:hypothetical protein
VSYLGTRSASGISLITDRSHDLAHVLVIDGLTVAFTTHDDVSGLATAWSKTMKDGLEITGAVERSVQLFAAKVDPTSMAFTILDYGDNLLPLMFGESRTDIARTWITRTMPADSAQMELASSALGLGTVYVGHETVTTTSLLNAVTNNYAVTRGVNALWENEDGDPFVQTHEIDVNADPGQGSGPDGKPDVTDAATNWINRQVALYLCHRDNGTWSAGHPGSSSNDAELLWAGSIKTYREDGEGHIHLDCLEILSLLQASIGTRLYEGEMPQGGYISRDEAVIVFASKYRLYSNGDWTDPAGADVTMTSIADRVVTHQQIAEAINNALGALLIGGAGTYTPDTARLYLKFRDGRYHFEWIDSAATNYAIDVDIYLSPAVWEMLGWRDEKTGEANVGSTDENGLQRLDLLTGTVQSNDTVYGQSAPEPPLRFRFPTGAATDADYRINVANAIQGRPFVPQTRMLADFDEDVDGFLCIDGKDVIAVRQRGTNSFDFRGNFTAISGSEVTAFLGNYADDRPGSPIKVRQIWIEPGKLGETMLRLLVSTGTPGFNSLTYDEYPLGMGCGVPWNLVDHESWLTLGDEEYYLVIREPTSATKLINSALNLKNKHVTWADGAITVVTPFEAGIGDAALISLTESNKAIQIKDGNAARPVSERTVCDRNPESIINRLTLRYHADLGGSMKREITVNAIDSQSKYGETRSVELEAYGIYDGLSGTAEPLAGGAAAWERDVASVALAYFGKPLAVFERSYDFSLAAELYPGAKVSLTDSGMIDPSTGTRGVTGLLAWVVSTRFDWKTGVGRVRCVFAPESATSSTTGTLPRTTLWAPSARVDETYTGLPFDTDTVALYKFNETSATAGTNYTTLEDASSNGLDLTEEDSAGSGSSDNYTHIINGPGGPGTYARFFPGVTGGARMGRVSTVNDRSVFYGPWSFEAWVYPVANGADQKQFVMQGGSATGSDPDDNMLGQINIRSTGAVAVLWEHGARSGESTESDTGVITHGEWSHLAVTVDIGATASVNVYVNGVEVHSASGITKADGGANARWRLGYQSETNGPTSAPTNGAMRAVRISGAVRTAAEIAVSAARTDYTLDVDAGTYALWLCDEVPDARDESDYGYHLRKVAGSYTIADPLAPDSGKSRSMGTTAVYVGHWGYEPLRSALAGDWTWECWTDHDSGYQTTERGYWVYGGAGASETQANNRVFNAVTATTRLLRTFWEHSAGTDDAQNSSAAIFADVADGEATHHLAVAFYETSPSNYAIDIYKDGAFVETLTDTTRFDGGTTGWLIVGATATSSSAGRLDDVRFSSVRRTAGEIAGTYAAWQSGYNASTKTLKIKEHEYTAESESVDVSFFQVGDTVHVVDLSPTDGDAPVEWDDTIAARDNDESTITFTTGLGSPAWPDRGHFVVEWAPVGDATASMLARGGFLSDAETASTGNATNDAYLWGGDISTYPGDLEVDRTQRYRRIDNSADDVGTPGSVHKLHEIRDFANQASVNHQTTIHISHANICYGSTTAGWSTIYGPIWIPLYRGRRWPLSITARLQPNGSATYRFKTSRALPTGVGSDLLNVGYENGSLNEVTYTAVSASGVVTAEVAISTPAFQPESVPGCWFTVDALPNTVTAAPLMLTMLVKETAYS